MATCTQDQSKRHRWAADANECPSCSCHMYYYTAVLGVYKCADCGCIYGECFQYDATKFYLPQWHTGPENEANWQWVDLTVISSQGARRFHGVIDRETKCIVQTG